MLQQLCRSGNVTVKKKKKCKVKLSPTSVPGEQDYKEVKKEVVVCQIHFQYSAADLDQVWISLSVNEKRGVNCVDTINSKLCKQAAFLNRTLKH